MANNKKVSFCLQNDTHWYTSGKCVLLAQLVRLCQILVNERNV